MIEDSGVCSENVEVGCTAGVVLKVPFFWCLVFPVFVLIYSVLIYSGISEKEARYRAQKATEVSINIPLTAWIGVIHIIRC